MSNITSHLFGSSKHLVVYKAEPSTYNEPEPVQIDHVFCIDVSGSMSGELPKLRDHLKNKVVKMVQPGDTLSLVWFSGKGQHGTLLTEQAIKGLLDVKEVHDLIDRFLHPIPASRSRSRIVRRCGTSFGSLAPRPSRRSSS